MKAIEGLDLPALAAVAKDSLVEAQKTRLVGILTKMHEERDTAKNQLEKDKALVKKGEDKVKELEEKITKVEAGDWSVIKEDGKGQPQVQGGGDKGKQQGGGDQGREAAQA